MSGLDMDYGRGSESLRGLARSAGRIAVAVMIALGAPAAMAAEPGGEPKIPPGAKRVPYDSSVFKPDPSYADKPYDAEGQINIYGGKTAVKAPRPLLETGREIYTGGPFTEASTFLGEKNPLAPHFYAYGDYYCDCCCCGCCCGCELSEPLCVLLGDMVCISALVRSRARASASVCGCELVR